MKKAVVAYIPALHQGYFDFFRKHGGPDVDLWVLSESVIEGIDHLRKDLRALRPYYAVRSVAAWSFFGRVLLFHEDLPSELEGASIVMPDEEISRYVGENYFHLPAHRVTYDNVFLRRDKQRAEAQEPLHPDRVISCAAFDREVMRQAVTEGERSSDWWRRVGGILIRDGKLLIAAHNQHLPTESSVGMLGDYRSNYSKGVAIELTTAEHVESVIIAEAAKFKIGTDGTSLYLTDFPCPPCAKLIAHAGIRKLYYGVGSYSMAETEDMLKSFGIEIVLVK